MIHRALRSFFNDDTGIDILHVVERIDGDYFSVMGLGLRRLVALLGAVGVRYEFGSGVTV